MNEAASKLGHLQLPYPFLADALARAAQQVPEEFGFLSRVQNPVEGGCEAQINEMFAEDGAAAMIGAAGGDASAAASGSMDHLSPSSGAFFPACHPSMCFS